MAEASQDGDSRPAGDATRRTAPRWASPVVVIGVSVGIGNFSSQFWSPFLPFFLLRIGATSDANALFWLALALAGQGIGRIIAGPVWGVLADRYGRKLMFVRALYAGSLATLIAGIATQPWHVVVSFTLGGLLSGFVPASIALTSVTVPREQLSRGVAMVSAAQYLGTTAGPALGAVFVGLFGLRGAILAGAILPSVAAFGATIFVPRDDVSRRQTPAGGGAPGRQPRLAEFAAHLSVQLAVAIALYFVLYAASNVLRVAAPIAIKQILHGAQATSAVGVAYTASGLGSFLGAIVLARFVIRPPRMRLWLVAALVVTAAAHLLLAIAGSVSLFTLWFALTSIAQGAMVPAANTLIAASVTPSWRGTAFGVASSFQALAFIVGPISAAFFATLSLSIGFMAVGAVFLLTGLIVAVGLREPDLTATDR